MRYIFTTLKWSFALILLCVFCREQMLQVLLRITEAVMKRPPENQRKDSFAESLASILFRVRQKVLSFTLQPLHTVHV